MKTVCSAVLVLLVVAAPTSAADRTAANVMVELSFASAKAYADPFNDVMLDVVFTAPDGRALRVPAFWAGGNVWKVRYASLVVGRHTYQSELRVPNAADAGLDHIRGSVDVVPYEGDNPLYRHGPLRVAANRRYLEHADGTPFFWLGDTWWMGLCHRLHWPDEFKTLAADRRTKGFNVIQIVAGLYPDMPPFDPRGANEAGFPWAADYARIRPEYFDAADERLRYLVDQGFTPCIVGAWGYFLPFMGEDKVRAHWRYLIARYGALPVVWCAAGEANLPWYRAPKFPFDDRQQVAGWTRVMRYVRETDPYHRPLTVHPTGIGRLSARHATDDVSLLDVDMLQTPHGEQGAVAPTVATVRQSYADQPRLPVINGEASYERLGDHIDTRWTRRMFWLCMTNGAAGHTYGANGIWQCNRKGEPHGPSPTAGSPPTGYGVTPWDEAMNFPGSRHVGFGKTFFERFEWWTFEPHPEWAAYASPNDVALDAASWIWFPEGDPARDAPAAKRYLRRTFTLPANRAVQSARLAITADDWFDAAVNGEGVGRSADAPEAWRDVRRIDVTRQLHAGDNVLAVAVENRPAPSANPAGMIARLEVRFADGRDTLSVNTDAQWRAAKDAPSDWTTTAFDDATWPPAAVVAAYGQGPWGRLGASDPLDGPQTTGIPGKLRVTYVPDPRTLELRHLDPNAVYEAEWFDPTTGASHPLSRLNPTDGAAQVPAPAGIDHDWVLVLRPAK